MTAFSKWETRLVNLANRFDVARAAEDARNGCWIYGAGGFGRLTAEALARGGYPVLGFVDRSARTSATVGQYRCIHPDDLKLADVEGKTYVHGLMNHTFASGDVGRWAVTLPFGRLLFPAEVCQLPNVTLENYWLARPATFLAAIRDIERVHDCLADAASAELYRDLLSYRVSGDPRLHPTVSVEDQYTPDFLPIFGKPIALIDAGAYRGDTLEALLAHGVDIQEWIAFEPDEQNLEGLFATAKAHRERLQAYAIYPSGLAATSGKIGFTKGRGLASQVLPAGAARQGASGEMAWVQALRLDDVVWTRADLYIKLDIEGAEMGALEGMMELLAEKRPTVAVSIYHRPADLWEIPLFFMRNFERPTLHIRQHGHHGFDTVLYVTL
ncbi:MAG: FkbM family methyltransferase [Pseudolabrys sp.]